jgi:hypothetical protein
MTDGRKRAFGVEGADVGLGLRPKIIGARVKRVEDPAHRARSRDAVEIRCQPALTVCAVDSMSKMSLLKSAASSGEADFARCSNEPAKRVKALITTSMT